MRNLRAFPLIALAVFAAGVFGETSLQALPTCSTQTFTGPYTYLLRGSYVGDAYGDLFDFSAAGRFVADGNGSFAGTETTSEAESIARATPYTGTYTINEDCTGSAVFKNSAGKVFANMDLVITSNGKEIEMIETDQGTNISGRASQQFAPDSAPQ